MKTSLSKRLEAGMLFVMIAVAVNAQSAKNAMPAPAPVPEQIAKAKTVFVSNAGADGAEIYSGGVDRPYNQFYAAMKSWGRYELKPAPAGSDLVFELLFTTVPTEPFSRLRLTILDPATHAALWSFTAHVKPAIRQSTGDGNLDDAMASLIASVKEVVARH
jgi:hypothetical protein